MEKIEYKGYTIEIEQEENAKYSHIWVNLTTMICFHKSYNLGDKHEIKHEDYASWEEMKQAIIKRFKSVCIKPLYLFDHSGITISTTEFSDLSDSGQVGFVIITRQKVLDFIKAKQIAFFIKKRAMQRLEREVEIYDQFLKGEVYGYVVKNPEGEVVESCYGYYGFDHEKSGLWYEAKWFIDGELKRAIE